MFCTIRCGPACSQQPGQVSMSRIRVCPPPLSVTIPPPSMTIRSPCTMFAVCVIVIVTGSGPQLKVMTPPMATAWTTAAEVQLAAAPSPMTWSGWAVLTARPAGGTLAWPLGLPYLCGGWLGGVGAALGLGVGVGVGVTVGDAAEAGGAGGEVGRMARAGRAALAW